MSDDQIPTGKTSPIRPTDAEAVETAGSLMNGARIASLSFIDATTGRPGLSRIAVLRGPDGSMVSLVSELSAHTKAMAANSATALLLGEADGKGDPLNQPRLTLHCDARFLTRDTSEAFSQMQAHYLAAIPKAKLYADFLDFRFAVFDAKSASLNGGFGKAYELSAADLV